VQRVPLPLIRQILPIPLPEIFEVNQNVFFKTSLRLKSLVPIFVNRTALQEIQRLQPRFLFGHECSAECAPHQRPPRIYLHLEVTSLALQLSSSYCCFKNVDVSILDHRISNPNPNMVSKIERERKREQEINLYT